VVTNAQQGLARLVRAHPELDRAANMLSKAIVASFGVPSGDQAVSRRTRAIAATLDHPAAVLLKRAKLENAESLKRFHLTGADDALEWEAQALGVPVELLSSVLRIAVLPDLEAGPATDTIETTSDRDIAGLCPGCGRFALLAESRGLEGRRFLRCGSCAADWAIGRGACPGCGTTDPHRLTYQSEAGATESRLRLWCCEACGMRLPIVTTLARLGPVALLVTELEALPLSLAVENQHRSDAS
jgi:formate dehydrogenase maturation protein FdhE